MTAPRLDDSAPEAVVKGLVRKHLQTHPEACKANRSSAERTNEKSARTDGRGGKTHDHGFRNLHRRIPGREELGTHSKRRASVMLRSSMPASHAVRFTMTGGGQNERIRAARQRNSLDGRLLGPNLCEGRAEQEREESHRSPVVATMGIGHRCL